MSAPEQLPPKLLPPEQVDPLSLCMPTAPAGRMATKIDTIHTCIDYGIAAADVSAIDLADALLRRVENAPKNYAEIKQMDIALARICMPGYRARAERRPVSDEERAEMELAKGGLVCRYVIGGEFSATDMGKGQKVGKAAELMTLALVPDSYPSHSRGGTGLPGCNYDCYTFGQANVPIEVKFGRASVAGTHPSILPLRLLSHIVRPIEAANLGRYYGAVLDRDHRLRSTGLPRRLGAFAIIAKTLAKQARGEQLQPHEAVLLDAERNHFAEVVTQFAEGRKAG